MNLLVLNTGSSSIKYTLFEDNYKTKIFSGKVERIKDYSKAIKQILNELNNNELSFDIIAHRVVHGGELNKPSLITNKVEQIIKKYSEFAPLHNPPALKVIRECKKLNKKQYTVFDTAFFSDLPNKAKIYPIPLEITRKFNLKKYGFHGISNKYVSQRLKGKTIVLHLGNGCSVSAINNTKPIDTSMGLTPLEGLMMGTRAGDIDAGLILFLEKKDYNMNEILNFKSGFKGLTGYTDFRDILKNIKNPKIKLAYDIFVYRIVKYVGAYIAVLNGLDNLVFTGAIGYNVPMLRKNVLKNLSYLKNKFKVHVIKTDEEMQIAKEVFEII
ncbi:MAG: acetate kinase [Nanoarchaeota archaeon]